MQITSKIIAECRNDCPVIFRIAGEQYVGRSLKINALNAQGRPVYNGDPVAKVEIVFHWCVRVSAILSTEDNDFVTEIRPLGPFRRYARIICPVSNPRKIAGIELILHEDAGNWLTIMKWHALTRKEFQRQEIEAHRREDFVQGTEILWQ